MKKRKLILVTDYYPFATGETFLENEVPYLAEHFDLTIVSSDVESPQTRQIPAGVPVYRIQAKSGYSLWEKCKYILKYLCSRMGRQELWEIFSGKASIPSRLLTSVYFHVEAESFLRRVEAEPALQLTEDTLVYSYWGNYKLLAFAKKRQRCRFHLVSRFHGYDLYNERFGDGRQPFKRQIDKLLDGALFVSQAGMEYYKRRYRVADTGKHHLFRLGTCAPRAIPEKEPAHVFRICSCSNVIPLKRVELIVEALKRLGDLSVQWIHFGDGNRFEEVKQLAQQLPPQIRCDFRGRVGNSEVLDFYSRNYVDCFITTSRTEGCPVSIMEALSYGMPVIATGVGGIPEMLKGTSNILLPENPEVDAIAAAIERIYNMTPEETGQIRRQNILRWQTAFYEKSNNERLVEFFRGI